MEFFIRVATDEIAFYLGFFEIPNVIADEF